MADFASDDFLYTHPSAGLRGSGYTTVPAVTAFREGPIRSADKVFVTRVDWCKREVQPEHEFLVFHVKERGLGRETVIVVERDVAPQTIYNQGDAKEATHLTSQYSLQSRSPSPSPSNSIKDRESSDRLHFSVAGDNHFVHSLEKKHKVLVTLSIDGEHFSVAQLAVLASVVHEDNEKYNLLTHNCYWFADTVYSVIKEEVEKEAEEKVEKSKVKEHYTRPDLRGRFKGMTVSTCQPSKEVLERVVTNYHKAWEDVKKELAEVRAKRQRNQEQIIAKAKDEETRKTRQAEERASEEAKKREAAETRAQTAEAMARVARDELKRLRAQLNARGVPHSPNDRPYVLSPAPAPTLSFSVQL